MFSKKNSPNINFPSYGVKVSYDMKSVRLSDSTSALKQQGSPSPTSENTNQLSVDLMESNAEVWFDAGNVFISKGEYGKGIECFTRAIALQPGHLFSVYNRAGAYLALGSLNEALTDYQAAEKIDPGLLLAKYNSGVVWQMMGMKAEALACFLRVLEIQSDHLEALYNAGCILLEDRRYVESLEYFDRAVRINSTVAEIHNNRATALQKLGDKFNALKGYQKALSINPKFVDACCNYGILLADFNRHQEAIDILVKAVKLGASSASAWHVLGMSQSEVGHKGEALVSLKRALKLDPGEGGLLSDILHMKMKVCDWDGLVDLRKEVIDQVDKSLVPVNPFSFITNFDDLLRQRKSAEKYVETIFGAISRENLKSHIRSDRKIRIGYYSSDFQEHATMHLIIEVLEAHSHENFEWYAFNFGGVEQGVMRGRVRRAMDHFIDVQEWSDEQIAKKSRDLCIDIAVDMKGFTGNSRFGIFYRRCAPIQVAYLGYPGTCGSDCIDYVIADKILIPEEFSFGYSENIAWMPDCYQANNSKREISNIGLTRHAMGLPENCFVYCSFNGNYKITPEQFDCWMRILRAVENSVLWIYIDNDIAKENLLKAAAARSIDPKRLVFATSMKNEEHLARYKLADLFLDTYPCNAHTTASDALWAGVPVLTYAGKSFASRVAASLLTILEMQELVTCSLEDYEMKAIEIGSKPAYLNNLKKSLFDNNKKSTLFDGKLFAQRLEMGYRTMYERHCAGLKPAAMKIPA